MQNVRIKQVKLELLESLREEDVLMKKIAVQRSTSFLGQSGPEHNFLSV